MEIFSKRKKYIDAKLPNSYRESESGPYPKFGCFNCDHAIVCKNYPSVKGWDATWCNREKVIIRAHIPEYNVTIDKTTNMRSGRHRTEKWTDEIKNKLNFINLYILPFMVFVDSTLSKEGSPK